MTSSLSLGKVDSTIEDDRAGVMRLFLDESGTEKSESRPQAMFELLLRFPKTAW